MAGKRVLVRADNQDASVRFSWRSSTDSVDGLSDWIGRIDLKNRRPGTSAPTLASAWSGPVDLLSALGTRSELAGMTVNEVKVEARSRIDGYRGNVRNHDLLVRGTTVAGEPVVVCVEAKAGPRPPVGR